MKFRIERPRRYESQNMNQYQYVGGVWHNPSPVITYDYVEADYYEITNGVVTFYKDGKYAASFSAGSWTGIVKEV